MAVLPRWGGVRPSGSAASAAVVSPAAAGCGRAGEWGGWERQRGAGGRGGAEGRRVEKQKWGAGLARRWGGKRACGGLPATAMWGGRRGNKREDGERFAPALYPVRCPSMRPPPQPTDVFLQCAPVVAPSKVTGRRRCAHSRQGRACAARHAQRPKCSPPRGRRHGRGGGRRRRCSSGGRRRRSSGCGRVGSCGGAEWGWLPWEGGGSKDERGGMPPNTPPHNRRCRRRLPLPRCRGGRRRPGPRGRGDNQRHPGGGERGVAWRSRER